jgi:hypothetical protein
MQDTLHSESTQSCQPLSTTLSIAPQSDACGLYAFLCLQAALKQRGTHGIITLGKKFKSMDDCGNGQLSFEEFRKAMAEMSLPEPDVHRLFRAFDADCR